MTLEPRPSNSADSHVITRKECADCGTPMFTDGRILCPYSSEHIGAVEVRYVPESQLRGAVAAVLSDIVGEAIAQTPELTGDRLALTVGYVVLGRVGSGS